MRIEREMNKIQLVAYLEMTTDIWLEDYSKVNDTPLYDFLFLLAKEEIKSCERMELSRCGKLVYSVWKFLPKEEALFYLQIVLDKSVYETIHRDLSGKDEGERQSVPTDIYLFFWEATEKKLQGVNNYYVYKPIERINKLPPLDLECYLKTLPEYLK